MDETYQMYVNRVASLTLPTSYQNQLKNIQKSPKFQQRQPVSFPGYTVLTPPYQDDTTNESFYEQLNLIQQQLIEKIAPNLLIPLPPESFHLTLADLIWEDNYLNGIKSEQNFDEKLEKAITESFETYQKIDFEKGESQWQILGLLVFPRALVVGLVPCNELSYDKIYQLRRTIYQNKQLIGLGIQQQYLLTAHVTLGYFDEIPDNLDRSSLESVILSFNDQWIEKEPQILKVAQGELRKFENMTEFLSDQTNPKVMI
ncbi:MULTISPECIES: DUF1868 domain-containing protein [Crocosphaera]|uniref:DUF1868 domain-containing protein n=3 Tax=Crocosphaera watsonii TaxID=263511 RepID=T2JGI3_CROWT|nr:MULTISPECIES: DUF1868 domain-containing protein [Crocosphaera]EHJ11769.1 hypothetical protein CWATWH0003_3490 [Crocosphaera watsonii WH 0003]NQZ61927.1 DUF1868 domain-containing protein [Crocosphaera sp.]CCQ53672.1 hypothetical protein CWATWH0005_131 [Crocosphaera watsonii WH 0005]CCQ64933.1 hypothetical protein CWATWH0402_797 [Crocosphaera watsonii WH 0402]